MAAREPGHDDEPLDTAHESEETEVLRSDSPAAPADRQPEEHPDPQSSARSDAPAALPGPVTEASGEEFRDPAVHEDPEWRPGLLPRDPDGTVHTGPARQAGDGPATRVLFAKSSGPTGSPADTARFGAAGQASAADPIGPAPLSNRRFDPMAMIAGTVFMAIAVMYMLDAGNAVDARPGLLLALAVIGVGASGFAGAVWAIITSRRSRR